MTSCVALPHRLNLPINPVRDLDLEHYCILFLTFVFFSDAVPYLLEHFRRELFSCCSIFQKVLLIYVNNMQAKESQTAAKNTDMKPNFRPLSSPPAGLQREKKHCPRKALLSFQWWVKTRLFLIDTTCGGVFCGWIPSTVPPTGPSPQRTTSANIPEAIR